MKSWYYTLLCFLLCCIPLNAQNEACFNNQADLIIYSYDRPLQLYAFLESIDCFLTGLKDIFIVYRSSDELFQAGYEEVWRAFSYVRTFKQGNNPQQDFKPLTMQTLAQCTTDYILFAVDDIIVKDYVDLAECIQLMERTKAYGFYLRLGKHLTDCYSMRNAQALPEFEYDDDYFCVWCFGNGQYDWNYPHSVDMTLFRKRHVETQLRRLNFITPNHLEGVWAGYGYSLSQCRGVCFAQTKIVNVPLNKVQNTFGNRHMNFMSTKELLDIFTQGKKIDIMPLFQIKNKAAHVEYEPRFILRHQKL